MQQVREEWIDFALINNEPLDIPKAKEGIKWLYGLAKLPEPTYIVMDSPLGCQMAANILKGKQVWEQVRAQVRAQVGAQVRAQVWEQVWAQVRAQVVEQGIEYISFGEETLFTDAPWVAFYDYFLRIGVIKLREFEVYKNYLKSGVCWTIFLEGTAFICGRPEYIKRDSDNRLHCENGPAVLWRDGYANHFWHGVSVTRKLIEAPETLTKEDLAGETNAEVRRAMMEKLGERFFSLLDVEEVARDNIGKGEYARAAAIFRTREPDPVAEQHIQYVQVECHSTGRKYMLCVPPHFTSPLAAVAWTFGKTESDYMPLVEA